MAVTVTFDDYRELIFESAINATQKEPRAPYELNDKEGKKVALIPDFGVRVIEIHQSG